MSTVPNPLEQLSLDQLRQRTSMKWRSHPPDVLPLWVAEMDVPLAPPVHAALTEALALGDTGYPVGTTYAEAFAGFASERWGWDGIAVERTAIVPDVMLGIVEVLHLVTVPGDTVVVNCPVYPPFCAFLESIGRRVREAPLTRDGRLDLAALQEAFAESRDGSRPTAYLLCSPHNPTGTVHARAELTAVAALARQHGVRVVADEIHAPLVLAGAQFVPYLSVPGAENGFSLVSASKGWNLAGFKAALLVVGPEAADDLARLPEVVSHGPSHVAIIAHATPRRGAAQRWRLARRAARGAPRQPPAARRAARRAPAGDLVDPARGDLPGLVGLRWSGPERRVRRGRRRAWAGHLDRRTSRGLPGARTGRAERGRGLRHRGRRARAAELRDVPGGPHPGRTADGRGGDRTALARGAT